MSRVPKQTIDKIQCPKCGELIPITEAFQHQLRDRVKQELDKKMASREKELQKRSKELETQEAQITKAKAEIEEQVNERLKQRSNKLEQEIKKRLEKDFSLELEDARSQLKEKEQKLEAAKKTELDLRKRERELEEGKKDLELEIARKINAEKAKIEEETTKRISEEHRMKDLEKDKQISDMRLQIDELKRKAEQGSQQLQGEVQELDLEMLLKENYPTDIIEPVPKGMGGADVIQKVYSKAGIYCGSIVWESKRSKTWSNNWIEKLKDDQRAVSADLAVLISEVLPKDIKSFDSRDGIWIAEYRAGIPLCTVLREWLIHVERIKTASEGKDEKMEILFKYLTGPQFRQRVEAIIESFKSMQEDLEEEKRISLKRWAKREKYIQRVIANTAGMYGDLQGLIGAPLQNIPALEPGQVDSVPKVAEANHPSEEDLPF